VGFRLPHGLQLESEASSEQTRVTASSSVFFTPRVDTEIKPRDESLDDPVCTHLRCFVFSWTGAIIRMLEPGADRPPLSGLAVDELTAAADCSVPSLRRCKLILSAFANSCTAPRVHPPRVDRSTAEVPSACRAALADVAALWRQQARDAGCTQPWRAIARLSCALMLSESAAASAALLANRSCAFLAAGAASHALEDATAGIVLCPSYAKAWYRRAEALRAVFAGTGLDAGSEAEILAAADEAMDFAVTLAAQRDGAESGKGMTTAAAAATVAERWLQHHGDRRDDATGAGADTTPLQTHCTADEGSFWTAGADTRAGAQLLREAPVATVPLFRAPLLVLRSAAGDSAAFPARGADLRATFGGSSRCTRCFSQLKRFAFAESFCDALFDSDTPLLHHCIPCPGCCHVAVAHRDGRLVLRDSPCAAVYCSLACLLNDRCDHAAECAAGCAADADGAPPLSAEVRLAIRVARVAAQQRRLRHLGASGDTPTDMAGCGSVLDLCDSLDCRDAPTLVELAGYAVAAAAVLQQRHVCASGAAITSSEDREPRSDVLPPTADEILLALCQVASNAFAVKALVPDTTRATGPAKDTASGVVGLRETALGLAVYQRASLFNHACDPNCVVRFEGNCIVVTASSPIARSEPCTVSYGFARFGGCAIDVTDVAERRKALQASHCFTCQCRRCVAEASAAHRSSTSVRGSELIGSPLALVSLTTEASNTAAACPSPLPDLTTQLAKALQCLEDGSEVAADALEQAQRAAMRLDSALHSDILGTGIVIRSEAVTALASGCDTVARVHATKGDCGSAAAWLQRSLHVRGALSLHRDGSATVDTTALGREPGLALDLFKLAQLAWNAHGARCWGRPVSQIAGPQLTPAAILSLCNATAGVLRALLPASDPLLVDLADMQRILRSAISGAECGSTRSPRLRGRS